MEKPVRAFYKARVVYKNPEWIDGYSTPDELEYALTKDIVLAPPPDKEYDIVQQHAMLQQVIAGFWAGNIPLMVELEIFIHPNRIISVQIVNNNIEIATVSKKAVQQAVVG